MADRNDKSTDVYQYDGQANESQRIKHYADLKNKARESSVVFLLSIFGPSPTPNFLQKSEKFPNPKFCLIYRGLYTKGIRNFANLGKVSQDAKEAIWFASITSME